MGRIFSKKPQGTDTNHNRHQKPTQNQISPWIHKTVKFPGKGNILLIVGRMCTEIAGSAMEKIQEYGPLTAVPEITDTVKSQIRSGGFSICLRLDQATGVITCHSELENIRMYGRRDEKHAEMIA
ncbi:MAG: hypothetical protein WC582_04775 [Patescibacteria group bacterium]